MLKISKTTQTTVGGGLMNFSKVMLAVTVGFVGGVMLSEYSPKFREVLDKGKQILSQKNQ